MNTSNTPLDREAVIARLTTAGMSAGQARAKADLLAKAQIALEGIKPGSSQQLRVFFVPGRIECLGKHTDYAGGRSLICAVEQGFVILCCPRSDGRVRMVAAESGELAEFALSSIILPNMGHWSNYPMTVASRLASNFPGQMRGCDLAFISDLPKAAGMSSSSALLIASYFAMASVNNLSEHPEYKRNIDSSESLANYLGTVENGQSFGSLIGSKGVGTFGGSEDHTAILCCQASLLSCYSYCPVQLERRIPLPDGYVFAIAASGVVADKTGQAREKYNRASRLASAVLDVWNKTTGRSDPHIAEALASSTDAAGRFRATLGQATHSEFGAEDLLKRFEHFFTESEEIIPAACDDLVAGRIEEFGSEVDRSQELSDILLDNQVANTVFLAQSARKVGAAAASAFGGGFGGAVWALVRKDIADEFLESWANQYEKSYPREYALASFFLTRPGPAALCITDTAPSQNPTIL